MSLLLDSQQEELRDDAVAAAFATAVRETVKPGDVVLDLGCGTGLRGLFACRAGARRIYAVDGSGMTGMAARIARESGFADRIVYLDAQSTHVTLPERVDVVVTDMLGRMGYEGGLFEALGDARRRLLRAGGALIPSRMDFVMAPVQDEVAFRRTDFWRGRAAGFDFSAAAVNAANTVYAEYFRAGQLLANPTVVATCDLAGEVPVAVRGESTFEIRRNGVLHGFAGWFSALLAPGVRLTNCPVEPIHTRRACAFLPLGAAVPTTPGDRVTVVVDLIPAQSMASWQVRVADAAGGITARFRHSTLHGLQIAREDLRRVKPDYVPTLDAWGRARRTVVNLCDGHRSTAAIGAELWRAHGDLFDSVEEAAAFAGEVIMAYSL